ncbi:hypothetical protein [Pseudodesulfovibrio tunisiensis]|uniref:hypothetical protein n=1 Tax=Pseudodesulfovibrio tunisiensis TaxID=463192 RepID=UPI001FB2EF71|nr:hypothetical protein [Pseudodesulfovibrio tunisiensis]
MNMRLPSGILPRRRLSSNCWARSKGLVALSLDAGASGEDQEYFQWGRRTVDREGLAARASEFLTCFVLWLYKVSSGFGEKLLFVDLLAFAAFWCCLTSSRGHAGIHSLDASEYCERILCLENLSKWPGGNYS